MKKLILMVAAAALLTGFGWTDSAGAGWNQTHADKWAARHAAWRPWHGQYNNERWGRPLAVVLPPTVSHQTNWSWGVTRTRVTPLYHQFHRAYPGPYAGNPGPLYNPPDHPSSTTQHGSYYIRGPWTR